MDSTDHSRTERDVSGPTGAFATVSFVWMDGSGEGAVFFVGIACVCGSGLLVDAMYSVLLDCQGYGAPAGRRCHL